MTIDTFAAVPGDLPALTIDGVRREGEALLAHCRDRSSAPEAPDWERAFHGFVLDWFAATDTILQRSSGTTGTPKDIILPKSAMAGSARNTLDFFGLKPGATALLCLPLDYIAGKMMVVRAAVGGLDLVLAEPSGSVPLPDRDIDFCAMVPLQVSKSLGRPEFRRIRALIIGGAEISPELEASLAHEPVEAWATYGMAETCSQIGLRRVNGPSPDRDFRTMRGVAVSLDDRGCLAIDADYLPGRVQTNDVAELTGPDRFRWLGRHDNLINSGGLKVSPEDLEAKLTAALGRGCAIVGLPDPRLGQRVVAVFEGRGPFPSRELVASILGTALPRQALPKQTFLVDSMPRNASFKLDRRALVRLLSQGADSAD